MMGSLDIENNTYNNFSRAESMMSYKTSTRNSAHIYKGNSNNNSPSAISFAGSHESANSLNSIYNRLESDVEFIDPLDPKYECPVCCQVCMFYWYFVVLNLELISSQKPTST